MFRSVFRFSYEHIQKSHATEYESFLVADMLVLSYPISRPASHLHLEIALTVHVWKPLQF